MIDALVWAGALSRACASVGVDALAQPLGTALPLAPEPLTEPARFAALVRDAGIDSPFGDVTPERIRRTDVHAPSSNCVNSVLALDWRDESAGLPRSVFLKQPASDLATRLFANLIGFWRIECAVGRNLSRQLPIDTPKIYAVAEQRSRFVILMENLNERRDVKLFVNREMLEGLEVERARRCVRTLARLHAGFEGWPADRREAALPIALHPFLSPTLEPIMLAVNRLAVPRCAARAGGVFGEPEASMALRALAHWGALQCAWYREPLTLVHGDSHLGNFFEVGDDLGMLDFQGAHWSRGTRDVAYLLMNSMPADALAQHEKSLVETYVEARAELGAPIDADTAWNEYRGFSFQTLMTAVVSLGLGSFTDSDEVIAAMLERSVAAVRRLRFAEWLEESIANDRNTGDSKP